MEWHLTGLRVQGTLSDNEAVVSEAICVVEEIPQAIVEGKFINISIW